MNLVLTDVESFRESYRSLKKKEPPVVCNLETFPNMEQNCSFRMAIRAFLERTFEVDNIINSLIEDELIPEKTIWVTYLYHPQLHFVIPLYVIEVDLEFSKLPYCDQCNLWTGWGYQYVSRRNYHFIIPSFDQWDKPFNRQTTATPLILHGYIHTNGFGHLLDINGGLSHRLRGTEVMNLWDKICASLRVRKISLRDNSIKKRISLRFLYGIAYKQSWFERHWNYTLLEGGPASEKGFNFDKDLYIKSLSDLSALNLDEMVHNINNNELSEILKFYRNISPMPLTELNHLFQFMLQLVEDMHKNSESNLAPTLKVYKVWQNIYRVYYCTVFQYPEILNWLKGSTKSVWRTMNFAKSWSPRNDGDDEGSLMFIIRLPLESMPVSEVIFVPQDATIFDVRQEAQGVLCDTYFALQGFFPTGIRGLEQWRYLDRIFGKVESGTELIIEGYFMENHPFIRPIKRQCGKE